MDPGWHLDHLVIRSADIESSLVFYKEVLGLPAEREEDWRRGKVFFPSIRINPATLLDLFPAEQNLDPRTVKKELQQTDHFCLALPRDRWEQLKKALPAAGYPLLEGPVQRWGARGQALSLYIRSPDGLVLELRTYDS